MTLSPDVSQCGQYWFALASTTNEKVKAVVCKYRIQAQLALLSRSMGSTFKDSDVVLSLLAETSPERFCKYSETSPSNKFV